MEVLYKSTRGNGETVTASRAILKGLSDDGGLFVPTSIPALDVPMEKLAAMSYQEVAYEVMSRFLTDFTEDELKNCIANAYDAKFDTEEIAPLTKADGVYYLELFHGATIAFKDMALSILPHLMTTAAKKNGVKNEIVILTATSGDTGKAAMAGFADVPGTRIIVFYPKNGVSPIQEKQMVTQKGKNTYVVAIHGNFDDAQTGVKKMFNDKELGKELADKGFQFSSANSINIGRLVPQVVYYVYAYANLVKNGEIADGEKINVTVPTGNFGNILAAFYAKQMGLPIAKLICASNENKVLFDFFRTGVYDRNRDFILTTSPSMDILISSNLERLIYRIAGNSEAADRELMQDLAKDGKYEITDAMKKELADFYGNYASEQETADAIAKLYSDTGYVIDTHTAVAAAVYGKYREETYDETKTVIASTASPYKFTSSVLAAIAPEYDTLPVLEQVDKLSALANTEIPRAIEEIRTAPVLHTTGQQHPLLLPAGQFPVTPPGQVGGPHLVQQAGGFGLLRPGVEGPQPAPALKPGQHDLPHQGGKIPLQVGLLGQIPQLPPGQPVPEPHRPAHGRLQAQQRLHQGGLAAAVLSHDAQAVPRLHRKGKPPHHRPALIAQGQIVYGDLCHQDTSSTPRDQRSLVRVFNITER